MQLLTPPKAPNLQVPSQQYSPAQQQFLVNQLKLYFTQLDQTNAALIDQTRSLAVLQWLEIGG